MQHTRPAHALLTLTLLLALACQSDDENGGWDPTPPGDDGGGADDGTDDDATGDDDGDDGGDDGGSPGDDGGTTGDDGGDDGGGPGDDGGATGDDGGATGDDGGSGDAGNTSDGGGGGDCGEDPGWQPLAVGSRVKHVVAKDHHGETFELASLCGKPIVLDVGATWCHPCQDIAAYLAGQNVGAQLGQHSEAIREMVNNGTIEWVTVLVDGMVADAAQWDSSWPNPNIPVIAEGDAASFYSINTFPRLMVVDETMTFVDIHEGVGNVAAPMQTVYEMWGP